MATIIVVGEINDDALRAFAEEFGEDLGESPLLTAKIPTDYVGADFVPEFTTVEAAKRFLARRGMHLGYVVAVLYSEEEYEARHASREHHILAVAAEQCDHIKVVAVARKGTDDSIWIDDITSE